jgi:LPXTG-site transpeptidase (sortase) family protein
VKKLPQILISIGILLIFVSLLLFIYIFIPVASVEISYSLNNPKLAISQIIPVDKNFSIVIPKIGANAKIIPNVDPYNSNAYQIALTKGVAQAKGTATPNSVGGSMFLFSHSSVNLLEATRYNSVFYLLSKLNKNDEVYIYYKNIKYKYAVNEIKIVDAKDVSYLNLQPSTINHQASSLTLMTCWPAGTDYKRLVIIANQR